MGTTRANEVIKIGKEYNLTGKRFGNLEVVSLTGEKDRARNNIWLCKCDCGNTTKVPASRLVSKNGIRSCGCSHLTHIALVHEQNKKHGMSHTKIYHVWESMIQRCNPNSSNEYSKKYYANRGISVCKEWRQDFVQFYKWASENGYKDGLTIDRIDGSKGYEPSNCRWVTRAVQSNNTRRNVYISFNGETHTVAEWSKITGVKEDAIHYRTKHGWPMDLVFDKENHKKNPVRKWWENE